MIDKSEMKRVRSQARKVVVTGGRTYSEKQDLKIVLNSFPELNIIIQGGASGADFLAKSYAIDRCIAHKTYRANWDDLSQPDARIKVNRYGKKYDAQAGHRRNNKMLIENTNGVVVAFPGGSGTNDCVKQAIKLGFHVFLVDKDSNGRISLYSINGSSLPLF